MPEKWNSVGQKVNGTGEEARTLNAYLKTLENKIFACYKELLDDDEKVTAESLKNKVTGVEAAPNKLLEIFQQHNDNIKKRQFMQCDGRNPLLPL